MNGTFRNLFGFTIFALVVQFLSFISRIDIIEDFTVFSNYRLILFFLGACLILVLIDLLQSRIKRVISRHTAIFGIPIFLLLLVFSSPLWIEADGMALGIMTYICSYWIILILLYQLLHFFIFPKIIDKVRSEPGTGSNGDSAGASSE